MAAPACACARRPRRARGAGATDVVVLAVAADDGVMPQTVEAAALARAADVPVVVALTKCDARGADPSRVRAQLLPAGVHVAQLGGDVPCVEIAAPRGDGLPALMAAVMDVAGRLPLGAQVEGGARMVCIESETRRALGAVATVVVRDGAVACGDLVLFQCFSTTSGALYGRVRSLVDMDGRAVERAGAGCAVGIVGLHARVPPGALCVVVDSEKEAKKLSAAMIARNERARCTVELARTMELARASRAERSDGGDHGGKDGSDDGGDDGDEGARGDARRDGGQTEVAAEVEKRGVLNVVIKGDVQGSADAVAACLSRLGTKQYAVRVLSAGVGDVTDSDVQLASATARLKHVSDDALIVAFNVRISDGMRKRAARSNVGVCRHQLIYKLEDDVKGVIRDMLKRWETTEVSTGKASVMRVFGDGLVAGCTVGAGHIGVGTLAKVWRFRGTERELVHEGQICSLKHFAKDIRVAEKGMECGIGFQHWAGFVSGDVVECLRIEKGSHA